MHVSLCIDAYMQETSVKEAPQLTQEERNSLQAWVQEYNSVILAKMIHLDFRTILKAVAGEKIQKASVFYLRAKLADRNPNVQ